MEPKVTQKTIKIDQKTWAENVFDFILIFNEQVVQNGAKTEPKWCQNEAKMACGGDPNAQQRPRDVQEHPQGHSGIKKSPKLHKNDTEKSSNNAKTACLES